MYTLHTCRELTVAYQRAAYAMLCDKHYPCLQAPPSFSMLHTEGQQNCEWPKGQTYRQTSLIILSEVRSYSWTMNTNINFRVSEENPVLLFIAI